MTFLAERISLGAALPWRSPDPLDAAKAARVARRAEELGFSDLWVTESTLDRIFSIDPVVALTAAAAVTTKIRVGVSVTISGAHSPLLLAHQWASLDVVSGGRAILGVGLGQARHFTDFGVPVEHRVSRFLEGVELVRALWEDDATGDGLDFHGRFYDVPRGFALQPVQRPLPIWFGGMHPDALRRAARRADGWMASGSSGYAAFPEAVRLLREELDRTGRDPASFPVSKRVFLAMDDDPAAAEARLRRWFAEAYRNADLATTSGVGGTPEQVRDRLEELADAGATHLLLNPIAGHLEQTEALAELTGLSSGKAS